MDAAEHDDCGAGLRGLARQAQRIADKIGYVLDFGTLVVMRENDRVALSSKLLDIRLKFGNELVPSMGRGSGGHARQCNSSGRLGVKRISAAKRARATP